MKTKIKKVLKVSTWLPGFDGFYNSYWEDLNENDEVASINQERQAKGLEPITYDDCEWDYPTFYHTLSKEIASTIASYLIKNKFISNMEFEKLKSPKEYNFSNDAIYIKFEINQTNEKTISQYLRDNKQAFSDYLLDHYTSYDGFFSSYSNDVDQWLVDDYLTHEHKLGSVLDFILRNHLEHEEREESVDGWLLDQIENRCIYASNYTELTEVTQ